ncbi:MAG: hypothetical protein HYS22_05625 [Deltaproteobacteria bacterium]|nr:hypothetical protein [Deltaproteobacteria bacterium]
MGSVNGLDRTPPPLSALAPSRDQYRQYKNGGLIYYHRHGEMGLLKPGDHVGFKDAKGILRYAEVRDDEDAQFWGEVGNGQNEFSGPKTVDYSLGTKATAQYDPSTGDLKNLVFESAEQPALAGGVREPGTAYKPPAETLKGLEGGGKMPVVADRPNVMEGVNGNTRVRADVTPSDQDVLLELPPRGQEIPVNTFRVFVRYKTADINNGEARGMVFQPTTPEGRVVAEQNPSVRTVNIMGRLYYYYKEPRRSDPFEAFLPKKP